MSRKAHTTAINTRELRSHQTSLHRSPGFHPSTKPKSRKKPEKPLTRLPSLLISPNPPSPPICSTKCPNEPPSTRIAASAAAHPINSEPTILPAQQEFDVSPIKKIHLVFSPDSAVASSTTHTGCLVKSRIDPSMWQRRSSRMASLAAIIDGTVAGSATHDRCLLKSRIDPSMWQRRSSRMTSLEATMMEVSPIKKIHLGFSPEIAVEGSRAGKRSARVGSGETAEARKAKGRRRGAGSVKVSEKEVSPIKKIHLGFSPETALEGSRVRKQSARVGLGETVEARKATSRRRGTGSVKVSEKVVSPIKNLLLEFSPDSAVDDSQAQRGFSEKGPRRGTGMKGSVKVSQKVDAGIGEVGGDGMKGRRKNGSPPKKVRKVEENCGEVCELPRLTKEQEKAGSGRRETGECYGLQGWTKHQEAALQRAYLAAKPSPHFWKKVSKMTHLVFSPDSAVATSTTHNRCLVKSRIALQCGRDGQAEWLHCRRLRRDRLIRRRPSRKSLPSRKSILGFRRRLLRKTRKRAQPRVGSVKVSEKDVSLIKKIHLGFSPKIAVEGSIAGKRSARVGLGETAEARKAKGRWQGMGSVKVLEAEVSPSRNSLSFRLIAQSMTLLYKEGFLRKSGRGGRS